MGNNKLVIFLPLTVMIGLFFLGYYSIMGADEVDNENLDERTELHVTLSDTGAYVGWSWDTMPSDGVIGDDYIEMVFYDQSGEVIDVDVQEAELHLLQGVDRIYSTDDMVESEKGVLFTFPNRMEENLTYGNSGAIKVAFNDDRVASAEVRYAHTWTHGSYLDSNTLGQSDIAFSGPTEYWVISRQSQEESEE
ncbi:hypothetical protein [Alteribacter aurantiacus]|uniref:hypothetical protein n=1 Tax=Alteribacter aurantiacus TaxID=254410 RepID=UPI0004063F90|nr:hypothetical protein [Alteribacter aurantiacus]